MQKYITLKCRFLNVQTNQVDLEVQHYAIIDEPDNITQDQSDKQMCSVYDDFVNNVIPNQLSMSNTGKAIFANKHNYQLLMIEPEDQTVH